MPRSDTLAAVPSSAAVEHDSFINLGAERSCSLLKTAPCLAAIKPKRRIESPDLQLLLSVHGSAKESQLCFRHVSASSSYSIALKSSRGESLQKTKTTPAVLR